MLSPISSILLSEVGIDHHIMDEIPRPTADGHEDQPLQVVLPNHAPPPSEIPERLRASD